MNCCAKCFQDREIIGYIDTNATQSGNCDFCNESNTSIIPAVELYDLFQELFISYAVPDTAEEIDNEELLFLHEHLIRWNLFRIKDPVIVQGLVQAIGSQLHSEMPALFVSRVVPQILLDPTYKDREREFIDKWQQFKQEIIATNRFIVATVLDLNVLAEILKLFEKVYRRGKRFYRARVSNIEGIDKMEMGKPPAYLATPGRANPKGISYLYLSNDIKTTIFEVRASLYDYITIAEFKLNEDVRLASLRNTSDISPFFLDNISIYLLYKRLIFSLEADLRKPLRKGDSDLDYIPTQYLCEFIKSLGYDGIEYSSSLNSEGFNIALFDDKKVICEGTKVYDVNKISYEYQPVE